MRMIARLQIESSTPSFAAMPLFNQQSKINNLA
jgi:hypothetical protein